MEGEAHSQVLHSGVITTASTKASTKKQKDNLSRDKEAQSLYRLIRLP